MKKAFVTIFLQAENVHLLKDVGMIPHFMGGGNSIYESTLVTIKKGDYPYKKYTNNLKIEFISGDFERANRDKWYEYKLIRLYLKENSNKIDVLNFYHMTVQHILLANYYKYLNKSGFVYIKMDNYYSDQNDACLNDRRLLRRLKTYFRNKLVSNIDLMTIESKYSCDLFSKYYNRKIEYLPNGFFSTEKNSPNISISKNNIFLTVGRLGTHQKNTELLLDAFANIYEKCSWNLMLVGSMEESCKEYMDQIFIKYKGLKERVIVMGEIIDKTELTKIYQSANVFIMPSRYENFSLAVVEAESNGCFLILSNKVAPYREFTNNGQLGIIIQSDNKKELSEAMLKSTKMDIDYQKQMDYVYKNFTWDNICTKLDKMIQR